MEPQLIAYERRGCLEAAARVIDRRSTAKEICAGCSGPRDASNPTSKTIWRRSLRPSV
jgi:hypothetical protein